MRFLSPNSGTRMKTSYHPCFFFHFINISSFFLNLDNIIIKLVNVRGTMQKEAEVNLADILACESQISFFFFALPGIHITQINWPLKFIVTWRKVTSLRRHILNFISWAKTSPSSFITNRYKVKLTLTIQEKKERK